MKFRILLTCFVLLSGFTFAQNASKPDDKKNSVKNERKQVVKLIESVVGTWQLSSTLDKNKKNQPTKDTVGLAWIEFKADGKYRSGGNGANGTLEAIDSGSYRLNEQGVLYLESNADKKAVSHPPAEWAIGVKNDVMTMEGRGSAHAQRYKYIYNKTKEGLGTANQ